MYFNNFLPFYFLDDEQYNDHVKSLQTNNLIELNDVTCFSLDKIDSMLFNQFNFETDIHSVYDDPDTNYFHTFADNINSCEYYFNYTYKDLRDNIAQKSISVCSLNINSIPKNLDDFTAQYVNIGESSDKYSFDVLGFTETKLTDSIDHLFEISGYQRFTLNCRRNSGGLALYVKDKFVNITVRNDLNYMTEYLESLFIEIKIETETYIFGIMYRRPNGNIQMFNQQLNNILEIISIENKKKQLLWVT